MILQLSTSVWSNNNLVLQFLKNSLKTFKKLHYDQAF